MPLLTIVFTDVVESSATKRDVSFGRDNRERDHAYLEKVQTPHFNLVRQCCHARGGREVSTSGDEFYLTFEDPVEAVRCAADIQKRLNDQPIDTPRGPLRLRIGVHSGFPEFFEGSWHGTDVDTASRVEHVAAERQILLSSRTYELVRHMTDVRFHPRGEFALKGVDRIALWEADWDGKGPRPTSVRPLSSPEHKKMMTLGTVAVALLGLIASIATYLVWPRRSTPGTSDTASIPAMKPRRSIAVLGFSNLTTPQEAWVAGALAEFLGTELAAAGDLRTIPGEDVAHFKSDLSLAAMSSYSKETLAKIRKILASDYVISGSYVAAGNAPSDSIRMDVRLQDASSGETLSSFQEAGTIGGLSELLKRVGTNIRNKLAVLQPTDAQASQVKAAVPTNPEAIKLYTEGLDKLRTFDALSARDSFESAIKIEPKYALAHAAMANAWQLLGYDANAKEEALKAMQLSGNLSDVDRRSIEGRYRELNSEWDQAIKIFGSLWGVFQDEPNYALELTRAQTSAGKGQDALATLAELRDKQSQYKDDPRLDLAEALAAESLSDARHQHAAAAAAAEKATHNGSRYLAAQAYWQDCAALFELGDLPKAETACQQSAMAAPFALEIAARSNTVLANIMVAEGKTREALEMRQQVLDTARKIGSQKDIIGALENLANLLDSQGSTKEARQHFEEAFGIARKIGDKQALLMLENDFAGHLYDDGDFTGAEKMYHECLTTARAIGDQQGTAMALQALGIVVMLRGDLAGAQRQVEQAIALQRHAGLQADLANSLESYGDLLLARGDPSGARKSYEESLKVSTELKMPTGVAASRSSIAGLTLAEGKPSEAAELARQAADVFQQEKLIDQEADARNILAKSLFAQGKEADAQAELDRAVHLSPQGRTVRLSISITAARLQAATGNAADARKALDSCMADALKMKFVGAAFEVALAEAEVLAPSDPKSALARLQTLQVDARAKGFLRVAADAERARQQIATRSGSPKAVLRPEPAGINPAGLCTLA